MNSEQKEFLAIVLAFSSTGGFAMIVTAWIKSEWRKTGMKGLWWLVCLGISIIITCIISGYFLL